VNAIYIPKRYGQSKVDRCPFCDRQAFSKNGQDVPVCKDHMRRDLPPMKCMCGETMDMLQGKWGVFFSCMKHGNMNLRKALEINPLSPSPDAGKPRAAPSSTPSGKMDASPEKRERKEITVRSDELDWM
jgi:hypothetical protein